MEKHPSHVPVPAEAVSVNPEELAAFLQGFVDTARSGTIEPRALRSRHDASMKQAYMFPDEVGTHDAYALTTGWHPYISPDTGQWWTLVSFTTGDKISFADAHIHNLAQADTERVERIAALAGMTEHGFGSDDPVVTMLAASNTLDAEQSVPHVTLRTSEQIRRFTTIWDLDHPAPRQAHITLGFDTTAEMLTRLGEFNVDWLLKACHDIEVPPTPASIVTGQHDGLRTLLRRIETWGQERRDQLLDLIQHIDIRGVEPWARPGNIQSFIEKAVTLDDTGKPEATVYAKLANKIVCDPWDFADGVYRTADGYYSEGSTQKAGEPKATGWQRSTFNSTKARAYAEVFTDILMPMVEEARHDFDIPQDIPPREQIVRLLSRYHVYEKALRISRDEHVWMNYPNVTISQWARACELLDDIRFNSPHSEFQGLPPKTEAILTSYGLNTDRISWLMQNGPGSSSEQILSGLYHYRP